VQVGVEAQKGEPLLKAPMRLISIRHVPTHTAGFATESRPYKHLNLGADFQTVFTAAIDD
jgi:hypothetical protein